MGRPSVSLNNQSYPYQYHAPGSQQLLRGPRKVFCFCLLAVIVPSVLISVPLLMRFVLYGETEYILGPSDMRMLDQRISTMWCEGETLTMNTTFTAYVTDGEPNYLMSEVSLTIEKTLIVPDDQKEYYGFYLLTGSTFRVYTCARHKGGTLLVVKGRDHLEHCAYIGDEDSAGDSDLYSNSHSSENGNSPKEHSNPSTSNEEISLILSKIRSYIRSRPKGYGKLKQNLVDWMLLSTENKTNSLEKLSKSNELIDNQNVKLLEMKEKAQEILNELELELSTPSTTTLPEKDATDTYSSPLVEESGKILRSKRHLAEVRKNTESSENGAYEDTSINSQQDVNDLEILVGNISRKSHETHNVHNLNSSIWERQHSHHAGAFNQTYGNEDGSNSESESSFSSSEEAMLRCQGVLQLTSIISNATCGADVDFNNSAFTYYEYVVNESGYYYFIFGSENEKRDNFIKAKFELDKMIYELPQPAPNCTDVKNCSVHFDFMSGQKLVAKIPQPLPHKVSVWDEIYIAETNCQPRTLLYVIFVLLVPVIILFCAFQ